MSPKPKRKPKNKNLSIDEQIELLLDDDEYIIWSEQTHGGYYFQMIVRLAKHLTIGLAGLLVVTTVLSYNLHISLELLTILLPILAIVAVFLLTYGARVNHNLLQFTQYVNVITNYQVMVYNPISQDVVYAFEHDAIQKFQVHEYDDNLGNITVDRRSHNKARYRVTPKYPLQFTLRGVDDLSKIVGLLRSQLGIEPDYLQIYPKQKRQ